MQIRQQGKMSIVWVNYNYSRGSRVCFVTLCAHPSLVSISPIPASTPNHPTNPMIPASVHSGRSPIFLDAHASHTSLYSKVDRKTSEIHRNSSWRSKSPLGSDFLCLLFMLWASPCRIVVPKCVSSWLELFILFEGVSCSMFQVSGSVFANCAISIKSWEVLHFVIFLPVFEV